MMLRAEGLTKSYGERRILVDCALSVTAGQCVLLRGPSGGGKSTLLRILALLEEADSGVVIHDQRRWKAGELPTKVSPYPFLTVVFQQLFLWPNLDVAQNISLVLDHRPNGQLAKSTIDMLERFSISHLVHRLPHECSLGERQRVALARAFLSKAQFLLLDEPSSALDRVNRAVLVQEIATLKEENRGLVVVTHDELTYDKVADQLLELEEGQLIER